MNIYLMVDGAKEAMFCLVSTQSIPKYDLLLAQKFLLESDAQQVWDQANRWPVTNGQSGFRLDPF